MYRQLCHNITAKWQCICGKCCQYPPRDDCQKASNFDLARSTQGLQQCPSLTAGVWHNRSTATTFCTVCTCKLISAVVSMYMLHELDEMEAASVCASKGSESYLPFIAAAVLPMHLMVGACTWASTQYACKDRDPHHAGIGTCNAFSLCS